MRLFLAVNLPAQLRLELHEASAALRGSVAAIRWLPPETYHITLKFLGSVNESQLAAVRAALPHAAAGIPRFQLAIGGWGAFPSLVKPRVVWIGADAPELSALQRAVESQYAPLGFPTESRPFHPHLTIGRLAANMRSPDLTMVAGWTSWPEPHASVPIVSIELMESKLSSSGARYEPLVSTPLGVGAR